MGEHRLGILHLADLHAEAPAKDGGALSFARVLDASWERSVAEVAAAGSIDLVCITGDLARAGRAVEYAALTGFVDTLTAKLGVPRARVFVVPGNHDVNRRVARGAWEAVRRQGDADADTLSRWMAGGPAPDGADAAHRAAVLRRQGDYRRWVRAVLGRPALVPSPRAAHPRLGYRETVAVRDLPFPVQVIGLDSAWLAGADGDAPDLRLTPDQVICLATARGERLPGFRLALVHHPVGELADGARCRPHLDEHTDLILRGHLHTTGLRPADPSQRGPPELAAGRLDGDLRAPNTFQRVDLTLDDAGRLLRGEVWVRRFSEPLGWGDDDTVYASSARGRLRWTAPGIPAPASGEEPPARHYTLDLGAEEAPELGAAGAALARLLDLPWTGPETWVRALARLLRGGARLRVEHAETAAAALTAVKLARRLRGSVIEAVPCPLRGTSERWT